MLTQGTLPPTPGVPRTFVPIDLAQPGPEVRVDCGEEELLSAVSSTITGTVSALAGGTRKVRRKSSHIPGDLFCQANLPVDLGGQILAFNSHDSDRQCQLIRVDVVERRFLRPVGDANSLNPHHLGIGGLNQGVVELVVEGQCRRGEELLLGLLVHALHSCHGGQGAGKVTPERAARLEFTRHVDVGLELLGLRCRVPPQALRFVESHLLGSKFVALR